ncbi:hypothetical protein Q0Z83_064660 [Actinoplanes sichuanensis]|uniref:Amino acid adenylation domain-containing protein n=1 Tax=Actinoplanes sichuanensis TaxID=512349 RepID=A0ABW4ANG8_9ACTN|nr:non-ribosomal peptide synthetase [Actinoplanes sichuanensis]BEL08275.1 hypothetical protein Q0Z83_064660 [Actinoplanes sichuanensis]
MNDTTYLDRIAGHARRHPDAVAARSGDERIGYRELLDRAQAVAVRLRAAGVRRGDRVGLRLPRGADLLAGMIGIGQAGAVVVPVSTEEPPARLAMITADAGIGVIVGRDSHGVPDEVEIVAAHGPDPDADGDRPPAVGAADIAYLIYTSGSTGRPKGVPVAHGNLLRYLDWCATTLLEPDVALPAITSPAFDASLKQLLGPLITGATVWLVDDTTAGDPRRVGELLDSAGPSALNCVPTFWSAVLDELTATGRRPAELRRLLLGGEPISAELLNRTRAAFPGLEIWNLYGPTEATANATAARIGDDDEIHLGSPIAGALAHVLRPDGAPAGDGETGELHLGGPQLALGYHGDGARTAARFVPDPFTPVPGGRMFRTGDLVRRHGDRLLFEGRADRQIKRSGVRLELGEIEEALRRLDDVATTAVVAVQDGAADMRLLAAVVPADGREPVPGAIRSALAGHLPRAALPDQIVVVPALPLTAGGKVDAAALRDLAAPAGPEGTGDATDPVEAVLIGVWQQVIAGKPVGVHTDFFDAGGHSLAMLRIVGRVAELLDVELAVDVFYDAPTVAAHADLIREQRGAAATERARRVLGQGAEAAAWRAE